MIRGRLSGATFAALLLVVLAYVAWKGLGTPGVAGLFPAVVGVVGSLAALVNLLQVLRGHDAGAEDPATAGADAAWLAGLSLGVPVAYAILLWVLGFWIASGAVLLALPWLLGYRRPIIVLAVCAGTMIAVDVVFVEIFDMRLPRGLLIERMLDQGDE
ncbi:tripartite tricarboxylate transporter TctB family protein [Falsiroseomonas sp.]|uniref:tripartite tricarboxylate transporter TctB family protein n=1 Tax=Falsiroseomonas sp. TaxID=2870721 RepID=UPI0034A2CE92